MINVLTSLGYGIIGLALAAISVVLITVASALGRTSQAMKDLGESTADLEKQTLRLNMQQGYTAEKWADIIQQGILTEAEFEQMAKTMGITGDALYGLLLKQEMLDKVLGEGDHRRYYLKGLEDIKIGLEKVASATEVVTNETLGMKQSIASATWTADGYTYSMQLFTQAEIDAATASGKKVDILKTQAGVTTDNIVKAEGYTVAIDTASSSVGNFTQSLKDLIAKTAEIQAVNAATYAAGGKVSEADILSYQQGQIDVYNAAGGGVAGYQARVAAGATIPDYLLGLHHGGIVTQPTMAMVGEAGPEAIVPLNEAGAMGGITINFTQPVFFDREDTMNKFVDMVRKGIQRRDRLQFGGAYSGG